MRKLLKATFAMILLNCSPATALAEPMLGEIKFFAGNFAPKGWALCDGQLLPINQNFALFSILGTTYGGDGRNSFALPDMRGRSPIHPGTGEGLSRVLLGDQVGVESNTLTSNQMPSHTHEIEDVSFDIEDQSTTVEFYESNDIDLVLAKKKNPRWKRFYKRNGLGIQETSTTHTTTVEIVDQKTKSQGGNESIQNRPPQLSIQCIIAIEGTSPSRN